MAVSDDHSESDYPSSVGYWSDQDIVLGTVPVPDDQEVGDVAVDDHDLVEGEMCSNCLMIYWNISYANSTSNSYWINAEYPIYLLNQGGHVKLYYY